MKTTIPLIFLFIYFNSFSQSDTEVFLIDIKKGNDKIELLNLKNISKNKGYDNQPSFFNDNTVLFSSTRNNQTDIKSYNINKNESTWLTDTSFGSEYSPLKIPNKKAVSTIRLDDSGLQRLYKYDLKGNNTVIIDTLKVGYHVWHNPTTLITSVLVDDRMDLVISNLKNNRNQIVYKNVGRSLHKIPSSKLIGFIVSENGKSIVKSLNPISKEILTVKTLPISTQDICWLSKNIILIPDGKTIHQLNTTTGKISVLHTFHETEIHQISRICVSPNGKYLTFVSEE